MTTGAYGRPHIETKSFVTASVRTTRDIQFAYPLCQGRSFHPQPCRRTVGPSDNPVGFSDSPKHVFAFDLFESAQLGTATLSGCLSKFRKRRPKVTSGRQNYRSLNKILQFAHVASPRIAGNRFHCWGRNGFDPAVHSPGVLVHVVAHEDRYVFATIAQRRDR